MIKEYDKDFQKFQNMIKLKYDKKIEGKKYDKKYMITFSGICKIC